MQIIAIKTFKELYTMITKKLMAAALLTVLGITVKAQFYVQGGLNLANITKTNDGQTQKNNLLPSFNAGIMARFGISEMFDIETGALLTGKGSKAETYYNGGNDYIKSRFNPIYIEIPFNAVIKFPLDVKSKSNIFIHAGPYLGIGVAGKSKLDNRFGALTSSSSSDIKFSNDDPFTSSQDDAAYNKLKRFDYGLNLGGGIDLGKFILKGNYGFGLAKINSTQSDNSVNDKNKFRTFSISAGIPIGR